MSILETQAPAILYVGETEKSIDFDKLGKNLVLKVIPVYGYAKGYPQTAMENQDQELMHQLILSEGRDEIPVTTGDVDIVSNDNTSDMSGNGIIAERNGVGDNVGISETQTVSPSLSETTQISEMMRRRS